MRPLVLLLVLVIAAGVACAQPAPPRRDVVLGLVGEPTSVLADGPSARILAEAVTETLVRRDATGELVARLAAEVPTPQNGGLRIEPDATVPGGRVTATFRIRPEARWQDGRPVTAEDVRFAWEEDLRGRAGQQGRARAERIEAVDVLAERIVRLRFRPGTHADDHALAARVMPRHLLADASDEVRAAYARAPVHAGPFTVAAWVPGIGATLAAFPDYVLGPPGLGRIEVRFFGDRTSALDALARGEIDVVPAPGLEADLGRSLERVAGASPRARLIAYYTPAESIDVIRFGPRFDDLRLRRAVELAVDRHANAASVFECRVRVPRAYLVPPGRAAADLGPAPRADPAAARAALAAAGFAPGRFGIAQRGEERLRVTIQTVEGSLARLEAARLVAVQLAAVGIAADMRTVSAREAAELLESGRFDLALVPERADDPREASDRYIGQAGPWFDVLATAVQATPDANDRRALFVEMQRVYVDAVGGLPLYQYLAVDIAPRDLVGVRPTPHLAPLTWNAHEWRFGSGP